MSAHQLDDLARALAGPMSRRRALAVFGGTVTALMLPPMRVRGASAQFSAEQVCSPATANCRAVTCPSSSICCFGPGSCPSNPHCCDPCDPFGSRCMSDGSCGPGEPGCKDECCSRIGQGECCGELCCTPDQICDKARGICCPAEPNSCFVPERACAEKVEKDVEEYMVKNCGITSRGTSAAGMQSDAFAEMGCITFAQTVLRHRGAQTPGGDYGGLDRCPKQRDRANCRCQDEGTRRRTATPAGEEPMATAAAASATTRAIRRRLRDYSARLAKHDARVRALSRAPAYDFRQSELEAAALAYRADVLKLRSSIARLRPTARRDRLARKHTLAALGAFAANLKAFAAGVGTSDPVAAVTAGQAGQAAAKRGVRASRRARKALGCGARC